MRLVPCILVAALLLPACEKATPSTFFSEGAGLVAALTPDANAPLPRAESWSRVDDAADDGWRHRSEMVIDAPLEDVRRSLSEWAGASGYEATDSHVWRGQGATVQASSDASGASVVEAVGKLSAADVGTRVDTFVRTGLTQLRFADAQAFLDARKLSVHRVERRWSKDRGARLELEVRVEPGQVEDARRYLESVSLLEKGKDTTVAFRPDGGRTMVTLKNAAGLSSTTPFATFLLAVEHPEDSQLW